MINMVRGSLEKCLDTPKPERSPTEVSFENGSYGEGKRLCSRGGVQTMLNMEKYFSIRKLSPVLSDDKDTLSGCRGGLKYCACVLSYPS